MNTAVSPFNWRQFKGGSEEPVTAPVAPVKRAYRRHGGIRQRITPDNRAKIMKLIEAHVLTSREIGDHFGISATAVRDLRWRLGKPAAEALPPVSRRVLYRIHAGDKTRTDVRAACPDMKGGEAETAFVCLLRRGFVTRVLPNPQSVYEYTITEAGSDHIKALNVCDEIKGISK